MPRVPRFKIAAIGELCRQLMYAPPEARRREMDAAERLVAEIEPGQVYPQEFIIFRITGYRPDRAEAPVALVGEALLGDLVTLIQRLSQSLELPPDRDGHGALRLEELTRRWKVSPKTLQRYRRRGLVCHYVIFADGVKRLACYEDALERFTSTNRRRLDRAASFSRVGEADQERMIHEAREQRRQGVTLNAAARQLAEKYGRSHETLRSILHRHDRDAGDPIFEETGPLRPRDARLIQRAARWGVPAGVLARRFGRTPATIHRVVLLRRADLLRSLDLSAPAVSGITEGDDTNLTEPEVTSGLGPLLPHSDALALIDAAGRLAPMDDDVERALIVAYHLLRRRARRAIDALPERPSSSCLDEIETDLRWMAMLKRRLVEAGLPGALGAVEQALGRRLADQTADEIRGLLRLAVEVVGETVESIDVRRPRLRNHSALATSRRLAAAGRRPSARRAATRHEPGSVTMEDPFAALCPWQGWLGLRPDLVPLLPRLAVGERLLLTQRYGLEGETPLTINELGRKFETPPSTAARLLRAAERRLRQLRRTT